MRAPHIAPGYPCRGPQIAPLWDSIWGLLEQHGEPLTIARVARIVQANPSTVRTLVTQAHRNGLLCRFGGGKPGRPFEFMTNPQRPADEMRGCCPKEA